MKVYIGQGDHIYLFKSMEEMDDWDLRLRGHTLPSKHKADMNANMVALCKKKGEYEVTGYFGHAIAYRKHSTPRRILGFHLHKCREDLMISHEYSYWAVFL